MRARCGGLDRGAAHAAKFGLGPAHGTDAAAGRRIGCWLAWRAHGSLFAAKKRWSVVKLEFARKMWRVEVSNARSKMRAEYGRRWINKWPLR